MQLIWRVALVEKDTVVGRIGRSPYRLLIFSGEIKIMYEIVETALAINHHSMFLSNNSEVSKKRSHS